MKSNFNYSKKIFFIAAFFIGDFAKYLLLNQLKLFTILQIL